MKSKRMNSQHWIKSLLAKILVVVMVLTSVAIYPSVTTKAASVPKLTKISTNISVGKHYNVTIMNKVKNASYHWSTKNKSVATVSQKGIVTGVKKGKATITCEVTIKNKKYKLILKVTVTDKTSSATPTTVPKATLTPTPLPTATPVPTEVPYTGKTAIDVVKEMGNGWNLGNTMEATPWQVNPSVRDCETAWGQPVTTKRMIDGLKASGINSVRIPIAWSNLMSKDGKYTIPKEFFDRIDEIISYVLDNNMYAMINDHWDGGWWEDFGSKDEAIRNEAMKKYETMWTQIANHYANYSDHLIFESANEELSWNYPKVNEVNQKFVDVVRASGGNNKERFLLIAGYSTDIDKTCDSRFVMPKDVIPKHLMVSVHYYTPSTYCIANKTDNSWGYMESWGTDNDKKEMRNYFEKMQKFTKEGYGVIIGEYGVTKKNNDGTWVVKPGTEDFFRSVVTLAKEYNYCAMLWDCNDWFDRNSAAFKDPKIASIYK